MILHLSLNASQRRSYPIKFVGCFSWGADTKRRHSWWLPGETQSSHWLLSHSAWEAVYWGSGRLMCLKYPSNPLLLKSLRILSHPFPFWSSSSPSPIKWRTRRNFHVRNSRKTHNEHRIFSKVFFDGQTLIGFTCEQTGNTWNAFFWWISMRRFILDLKTLNLNLISQRRAENENVS